jgi:hypothetical protein
VSYRDKP